jgi:hypothetical protein
MMNQSAKERLWQKVADIRSELTKLFPGADTSSLALARLYCKGDRAELLLERWALERWAALGEEMSRVDD